MMLEAGRLRHRVTVLAQIEVKTPRGGLEVQWETVHRRLPAYVEPLGGRELQTAMQIDPRMRYRIDLRYAPNVKAEQIVVWHAMDGDRRLEIVAPPEVDERDRSMVLRCGEASA